MPIVALLSGAVALIAGMTKFGMDAYRAKHRPPNVIVSIGNESIQVPGSYSDEQVAALVAVLKDKVVSSQAVK